MRKQALTLPYMGQASLRIVTAEGKVVCIDPYGMIGLLPLKLLGKNRGMHPHRARRMRMLRVQIKSPGGFTSCWTSIAGNPGLAFRTQRDDRAAAYEGLGP